MSLFTIGKRYQSDYTVEHIVPFFNGELAISKFLDERYYLQSAPLVREFTTLEFMRFKKLYDELDLDLLLPVSEMFLEGNQMVFVYPYQPIQPIRDVVLGSGINEEQVLNWFHQIIQTEATLQAQGIPMYIIRDPRNIGLNADGQLRVIFSGIEDVTFYQSTLNWATFLYCIASGEYADESMKKLPNKHSLPRGVAKVLQKSFRSKNLQGVQTAIEQQMNKGAGLSLISSIFGKKKNSEQMNQETSQPNAITPNSQNVPDSMVPDVPIPEPQNQSKPNQAEPNTFDWATDSNQTKQEDDPISAQLEQLYQSMEAKNQPVGQTDLEDTILYPDKNQSNPSSLDQTQFLTDQPQTTEANQLFDETQIFTSEGQPTLSDQSQGVQPEVKSSTVNDQAWVEGDITPKEPEQKTQTFTRQPSTQHIEEIDETQIFSASDLSSLEAELEAMHQEQKAEQEEQIPTVDVSPITAEKTKDEADQSPSHIQMQELEDLFGELEQLQSQNAATTNPLPNQAIETEATHSSGVEEVKVQEQQRSESAHQQASNLDSKVQELESLFDEINQLQSIGQTEEKDGFVNKPVEPSPTTAKLEKDLEASLAAASTVAAGSKEKQEPKQEAKQEAKKDPEPTQTTEPEDPLERLRRQFEAEQQALLEKQQKKFEQRKQDLIDRAQEEMQRKQKELLSEIEKQEEHILNQLKKDLELQEQEQLELEKKERKRLEQEFEKRKKEELRKLELEQLEKKHEQEVTKGLEEIRQEFVEREKAEQEKLDKEFAERRKEISEMLAQEQAEQEAKFKEQKQKEWEKLVKQYEEPEETVTEETTKTTEPAKEDSSKSDKKKEEEKQKSKAKSKATEVKGQEKSTKEGKSKRKRRKSKRSKRNLENQKAVEEQKNHDELASQFDDHKQEILAGKSEQDTASSEKGAN